MGDLQNLLAEFLELERGLALVRALILVVAGLAIGRIVGRSLERFAGRRVQPQQAILLRRIVSHLVSGLFLVSALHQLGFNLGVLLGAAGVLSVAIGIASQTSATLYAGSRSEPIGLRLANETAEGERVAPSGTELPLAPEDD